MAMVHLLPTPILQSSLNPTKRSYSSERGGYGCSYFGERTHLRKYPSLRALSSHELRTGGGRQIEIVYDLEDRLSNLANELDEEAGLAWFTFFSPCKVLLDRKDPVGAGVGKGISNAAKALWAANQFSGGVATEKELQQQSNEIGSVPFFFAHGAECCASRGEVYFWKKIYTSLSESVSLIAWISSSVTKAGTTLGTNGKDSDRDRRKRVEVIERRQIMFSSFGLIAGALFFVPAAATALSRSDFADMPALRGKDYGKTRIRYPDYTETDSGLQYMDLRLGTGPTPKIGDTVVVDWDGYTIGYYGRIFEARNKTKGGSFEGDDKDFFKFTVGSHEVIPAFEEAVLGMSLGGIRRIIVPPELGYPDNDFNKKGPRPTTFSGQRALDFVLRNQGLIDKTLLFDIELLKIMRN